MPAAAVHPAEAPLGQGLPAWTRLLLACARPEPGPPPPPPEDWTALLEEAEFHGLIPRLQQRLEGLLPVPRPVWVELWARAEANRRRNQAMTAELLRLLARLEAAGIPAIPYKGPALAVAVHGDLGLRQFDDLDLLLRPDQLPAALTVLEAEGYRPESPLPAAELLRLPGLYHLELDPPADGPRVELHWKTDAECPVEALADPAWWAALPSLDLAGRAVRGLGAADLLLVLCLHGSKHHWGCLGWLVDVAELLRAQPALDWEALVARARALGGWRRLALGLHLAVELLEAPLPEAVARAAAGAPAVRDLAAEACAALGADRPLGPWRRLRFDARLYDRPGPRLRFLLRTLLQPSLADRQRFPLPRGLAFLHPPLRLGRLLWKHGTRPFRKA